MQPPLLSGSRFLILSLLYYFCSPELYNNELRGYLSKTPQAVCGEYNFSFYKPIVLFLSFHLTLVSLHCILCTLLLTYSTLDFVGVIPCCCFLHCDLCVSLIYLFFLVHMVLSILLYIPSILFRHFLDEKLRSKMCETFLFQSNSEQTICNLKYFHIQNVKVNSHHILNDIGMVETIFCFVFLFAFEKIPKYLLQHFSVFEIFNSWTIYLGLNDGRPHNSDR